MAQKWPNLVQNLHFWSFWAKYCHFLHILSNDRPKTMCTRCLGEFSVMWVTKLMIPQVKKRIFCPKTTKFGPNLAFLVDMGQAMQVFSVPCWWVSWRLWRAGCISQDTYLLYQDIPSLGKANHFCAAPHFPDLWTIWIKYAHDCQLSARPGLIYEHSFGQDVRNLTPQCNGDDESGEEVSHEPKKM